MAGITQTSQVDVLTGEPTAQESTGNAANNYEASLGAGDEGVSSPTLSKKRIISRAFCTKLASSASAQNIGGGVGIPVRIKGIRCYGSMTGSATFTIAGLSTPTTIAALGTTLVATQITVANGIPVDVLPAGVSLDFPAGCQLTCSTAADGLLFLVFWEEMLP